ncbi:MAG: aspartate kinase [Solobacterium sp.]|nr:aspartate kinase [Solobacterium sp.]
MKTTVAKFGGTSLASAEQFRKVKKIIESDPSRRIIIVSAPGKRFEEDIKVTDQLMEVFHLAGRNEDFHPALETVRQRFEEIAEGIGAAIDLKKEFEQIEARISERADRDYVISRGEYLNAKLLSDYLGFTFVDPEWCVCFDEDGTMNPELSRRMIRASLLPLETAVIAGFYGADSRGNIRTLPRGGSDVTGSLAAAAANADLYENWTDVCGLLAADPRIVDHPKTVKYVTFRELRTLSYMGASVLHTDAVLPVSDLDIPINIRSTDEPEDSGTTIVRTLPAGETKYPIIGVAGRKGMSVIQVEKLMASDGAGFTAVMLDILKSMGLPFEHCLTGIDTVTLVIRSDLLEPCREQLFSRIREELNPDYLGLSDHLSMIAVIGEKGSNSSSANIRALNSLTDAGIPVNTINQGAGKLNLLIGVPEEKYEDAIRCIYETIEKAGL